MRLQSRAIFPHYVNGCAPAAEEKIPGANYSQGSYRWRPPSESLPKPPQKRIQLARARECICWFSYTPNNLVFGNNSRLGRTEFHLPTSRAQFQFARPLILENSTLSSVVQLIFSLDRICPTTFFRLWLKLKPMRTKCNLRTARLRSSEEPVADSNETNNLVLITREIEIRGLKARNITARAGASRRAKAREKLRKAPERCKRGITWASRTTIPNENHPEF